MAAFKGAAAEACAGGHGNAPVRGLTGAGGNGRLSTGGAAPIADGQAQRTGRRGGGGAGDDGGVATVAAGEGSGTKDPMLMDTPLLSENLAGAVLMCTALLSPSSQHLHRQHAPPSDHCFAASLRRPRLSTAPLLRLALDRHVERSA